MSWRIAGVLALMLAPLVWASPVGAQTPPTDLTELNLEEILALHIRRASDEEERSRWSVGYRYVFVRFDGNRDGTDDPSLDEVIWDRAGGEERTTDNFPVVPLEITQQAHLFEIGFDVTRVWSVSLLLPYILQETDHVSVIPGFDEFTIDSSGLGDISLSTSYPIWNRGTNYVMANAGLSLPVGSIDEIGATPRVPGTDTQLPYTMQIGSGTFDLLPSLIYSNNGERLNWGGQLRGTLRLGETDRDYTLGNRLSLSVWAKARPTTWIEPSLTLMIQSWGEIDGRDEDLIIDALPVSPYPANVTDPSKFGGQKIQAVLGATVRRPGGALDGHALELEWGLPVYQDLNGPQPKEVWRLGVGWAWDL